jgi:polyvinyl alcohol dehydrogenase (cytochrome)
MRFSLAIVSIAFVAHAASAQAPEAADTFRQHCATCHDASPPLPNVPTLEALRQLSPEAILNSLVNGKMQPQGALLTEAQRRAVSEFASGQRLASVTAGAPTNRCSSSPPMGEIAAGKHWNGWGNGIANTRYQPVAQGGLTAADLPKLKLKWAFGYANVSAARAQPAVVGGRLFAASENAEVHSLDPKTGCTHWTFKAQAGVRTALSVGEYRKTDGGKGKAVYFGDSRANAYAVDAETGQQIWIRKVDDHPAAAITGSPVVHDGKMFVPVQGLKEEAQGGTPKYECCTFRGSLSALDASTGEILWKTYTVDEPKPRVKSKDGVQMWGPAGGGIWSAPTVDVKRKLVYAATGNGYADPPQKATNAVIAFDIATGRIEWINQITPNDNWSLGCAQNPKDNPACPAVMGPDFDFAASPALVRAGSRELLVLPQKSGMAYALDPDKKGAIVWRYRIGEGSGLGGQWGGAIDGENAYFGVADLLTGNPGGMRAVKLADGAAVWRVPPEPKLCAEGPKCSAGQGGALTAIPGAVLSGSLDGGLRAYSTKDGSVIWRFDTNRSFPTVNGVEAKGGGMDGPGPVVVDGMIFVNSGYGGLVGQPGNVLLAFGLE